MDESNENAGFEWLKRRVALETKSVSLIAIFDCLQSVTRQSCATISFGPAAFFLKVIPEGGNEVEVIPDGFDCDSNGPPLPCGRLHLQRLGTFVSLSSLIALSAPIKLSYFIVFPLPFRLPLWRTRLMILSVVLQSIVK